MHQTIETLFKAATEAQARERYKDAFRLYRKLFEICADHPEANYHMGDLSVAVCKPEQSLVFYEAALRQRPETLLFWISYIGALSQLGMINKAKGMLIEAERLGLDDPSLFTLKKLLVETTRAMNNKSSILDETSLSNALASADKMAKGGQIRQALKIYCDILEKHPGNNRARANYQKLAPAELNRMSMIPREPPERIVKTIQTLLQEGQFHGLLKHAARLVHDYPASVALNTAEGSARRALLQHEQAISCFRKVLDVKPKSASTHFNIGVCHMEMQNPEAAEESFKTALHLDETLTETYRHWVMMRKIAPNDEILSSMKRLYKNEALSIDQRCSLCFALAKAHEDLKDHDRSFRYLSEGNALRKRSLNYDLSQDQELFEAIYDWDNKCEAASLQPVGKNPDFTPVFILGMPRSGTSLVEQILSCHSKVGAAGEFPYISNFSNAILQSKVCPSEADMNAFREKYIAGVKRIAGGNAFITDKFPLNFKYLNIIFTLFPTARIVNVNRDPKAICWSNFKQYFSGSGLGYTYDISDTVAYYTMYRKLMGYWYEKFGNRVYNLDYELLVSNQEDESRKLAHYVGLEWEDAMLAPQENKRIVQTASLHQVRQAVYKGSSNQWKAYERHLQDHFSSLAE
nr:sulfotransferase [uncultured Cohaesibacter sp.]